MGKNLKIRDFVSFTITIIITIIIILITSYNIDHKY